MHIADTPWEGTWEPDDPHAAFKAQVAEYTRNDPLTTLENLSRGTGVPVDVLARYALVRWCAEGSETMLQLGPRTVNELQQTIVVAEEADTDAARLAAYDELKGRIAWLHAGLDG